MSIIPEIDRDTFDAAMKAARKDDSILGDIWQRANSVTAKEYGQHFERMQSRGLTTVYVPEGE